MMSTLRSEIETGKSKHWWRNVFQIGRICMLFTLDCPLYKIDISMLFTHTKYGFDGVELEDMGCHVAIVTEPW